MKRKLKRRNQERNRVLLDTSLRMMKIRNKIQAQFEEYMDKEKNSGVRLMSTGVIIIDDPLPNDIEPSESMKKRWNEFSEKFRHILDKSHNEGEGK